MIISRLDFLLTLDVTLVTRKIIKLASSLDPGMEGVELYFDISPSAKTIVKRFGDEDPDKDVRIVIQFLLYILYNIFS